MVATARVAEGREADSVTERAPRSAAAAKSPVAETRADTVTPPSGAGLAATVNRASPPSATAGPTLTETTGSTADGGGGSDGDEGANGVAVTVSEAAPSTAPATARTWKP